MPIAFACGECGFKIQVKDKLAGKKIKCPKCQASGVVPGDKSNAEERPSSDPMSTIAGLNLDAFKDVVPDEEEEEQAEEESKPKPKLKRPRRSDRQREQVSLTVKLATAIFVILSLLIIAALVFVGPMIAGQFQI